MANYEELNLAEMMEESERLDSQGNNDFLANFVAMPEGEGFVKCRLLPPAKGKKFYCATRTHRVNGRSIHCPRELVNKNGRKMWQDVDSQNPCVICKYYNELWARAEKCEGKESKDLKDAARKIKPIERYYYNVIVRSQLNKKTNKTEENVGPLILSVGKTLHQRIVNAIVGDKANDEKPLGNVADIKNGRDFKIIKKMKVSGTEEYPEYGESKFLDASPLGEQDQVENWLSSLHDLAALRVLKSSEDMKVELKKHLGLIKDDDNTGFDITEFQKQPEISIEEQVRQATSSVAIEASSTSNFTASSPKVNADDAGLSEDAFLDTFKNM